MPFRYSNLATVAVIIFLTLYSYWSHNASRYSSPSPLLRLPVEVENLAYYPIRSSYVSVTGRWMTEGTEDQIAVAISGAYFEFDVANTSTVFVFLDNGERPPFTTDEFSNISRSWQDNPAYQRHQYHPLAELPAGEITLLAEIDHRDLIVVPNGQKLVHLVKDLSLEEHHIKVAAPMLDHHVHNVLQLNGIYLSEGGLLNGQTTQEIANASDEPDIGNSQQLTAADVAPNTPSHGSLASDSPSKVPVLDQLIHPPHKLLEIVTDSPGYFLTSTHNISDTRPADLASFFGAWDWQLGEMFSAEHTCISLSGMCLISNCTGGTHSPIGIGEAYFRTGPPDSLYYPNVWSFDPLQPRPDAIVLNLGEADSDSFVNHIASYSQTAFELHARFEREYVAFVKALRKFALLSASGDYSTAAGTGPQREYWQHEPAELVPIFVMRPLSGALEHATQNVVERLRDDGDSRIFWIDTAGWVIPPPALADYAPPQTHTDLVTGAVREVWTLNQQGNNRVAAFLHAHVCQYLAQQPEDECDFLSPGVYEGEGYVEQDQVLQRIFEKQRTEKLRDMLAS